jgi:hypothetical protein
MFHNLWNLGCVALGLAFINLGNSQIEFSAKLIKMHADEKKYKNFNRTFSHYKYLEAVNVTTVHDFGAKHLKQLQFLHIPKTGTTFAATLLHYCCSGLDSTYVDVIRSFRLMLPRHYYQKYCDPDCMKDQPRTRNGDPWGHIPYDSNKLSTLATGPVTAVMLRNPTSRLVSQLQYMQIIGSSLATSFGFREIDATVIVGLLNAFYDEGLARQVAMLSKLKVQPSVLLESAYRGRNKTNLATKTETLRATVNRLSLIDYQNDAFLSKVQQCVSLEKRYRQQKNTTASFSASTSDAEVLVTLPPALRRKGWMYTDAIDPHLLVRESLRDAFLSPAGTGTDTRDATFAQFPGGSRSASVGGLGEQQRRFKLLEEFIQCGLDAAVLYPGLFGCQTKMILGRKCYDSYTLTNQDVVEARRRLKEEFLFVGKRCCYSKHLYSYFVKRL